MVQLNLGLPEPPDPENSISGNNDLSMPIDSDTEEEDNDYEGYERLPMRDNPVSDEDDEDTEEEEDDEGAIGGESGLPSIETMDEALLKEVWSSQAAKDIEMDNDKVNQVKEAMLNFKLPASNIPDWANSIPEEHWKEHIFNRLQQNK